MKRILALIAMFTIACGGSNPTSVLTPAPQEVTQSPVATTAPPETVAPSTPVFDNKAQVNNDGSVITGMDIEAPTTACVYTYEDYAKQSFSHNFSVAPKGARTGFTPNSQWACGKTFTVQVDVQRGGRCPADPFADAWDGGLIGGRAGITFKTPACPTPEPSPTPKPSPSPSPSPTPSPSPSPSPSPTPCPTPTPAPRYCYYEPNCGVSQHGSEHSQCNEKALCEALPDTLQPTWLQWNDNKHQCRTTLPGVYLKNFRLTPGQSDRFCLKYTGNDD